MAAQGHDTMTTALVTGAGGFIGGHLTRALVASGYHVLAADIKFPEFDTSDAHVFSRLDLRDMDSCLRACRGVDLVFHLAADMGGIQFITEHQADVLRHNLLLDSNMLEAARRQGVKRFLYTSSACVYPLGKQGDPTVQPLKETDAWPAEPEPGYGWEKLTGEELCRAYNRDYGMQTRVARLHNIYGPLGTWQGGREKAPAALCRKVAVAKLAGADPISIDVWGDGLQTRSFCYVDDCVDGLIRLMHAAYGGPVNIGSEELVTINGLAEMISDIAGVDVLIRHEITKPQGVRGRNSDNTLCRQVLGWEPTISLRDGLARLYPWVEQQVATQRSKAVA